GLGPTWANALGKVPRSMRACWAEAWSIGENGVVASGGRAEHLIGSRGDTGYNPRAGETVRRSA
ncbi:MAG: hypothetical protein VXZ63_00360, partial [Planctomycetota bacterium]|nr:hypothetical protein [Planctomycetota bacterium]